MGLLHSTQVHRPCKAREAIVPGQAKALQQRYLCIAVGAARHPSLCAQPQNHYLSTDAHGNTHAGISEHSKAAARLREGLQKLGVRYGEVPLNTSTGHSCGPCSFGCAHCEEQDSTAIYLADMMQAGATSITCHNLL